MSDPIRFRLNGAQVEIADLPPTTTLLNWLRYERRLTGTKEGCAEGDCGACTVAMRDLVDGSLVTRPVCACIQTIAMLHGKDITTVEGITGPAGELHPVQTAMAVAHGSQCGFCTPGIVMSLWVASQNQDASDLDSLNELLGGNLCRCTGYGPILDAARQAREEQAPDWVESAQTVERALGALGTTGLLDYRAGDRRFWAPVTVQELADLVEAHPDATILSGATDVGLWITKQAFDPDTMIYTGRVAELREMRERDGMLEIGAAVTYTGAAEKLATHWPGLGDLIRWIGGAQVRASGTIGGNIANGSPIGDMPPALIALDARLIIRAGAARREIPLEDFFIDYGKQDLRAGEFVEAVRVPLPGAESRLRCYKVSKRFDQDITAILGCFNVQVRGGTVSHARIAYGGMAGVPKRAAMAEHCLIGSAWSRETVDRAMAALAEEFEPISDMRATADYRRTVAQNLLLRYFLETTEPEIATRVTELVP